MRDKKEKLGYGVWSGQGELSAEAVGWGWAGLV